MSGKEINGEPEYRKVSPEDFSRFEHTYYQETTQSLEGEGFSYLGDVEHVTWAHKTPYQRRNLRILAGDVGEIQAMLSHVHPTIAFKLSRHTTPLQSRFLDLRTEFSDGYFLITSNSPPYQVKQPNIDLRCMPKAPLDKLLEIHRERYEAYLTAHPSVEVRSARSLEEVLESLQRRHQSAKALVPRWKFSLKTLFFRTKRLPLKVHLFLSTVLIFIGFIGSAIPAALAFNNTSEQKSDSLFLPLFFLVLVFLGPILMVTLINKLFNVIPARCPLCGGKTFRTNFRPIEYTCRDCGFIHNTGFAFGDTDI